MLQRIMIHSVVKITRKDSGIQVHDDGTTYKDITLTFTDANGNEFELFVFSDDLGLGIDGVKS